MGWVRVIIYHEIRLLLLLERVLSVCICIFVIFVMFCVCARSLLEGCFYFNIMYVAGVKIMGYG